MNSKERRNAIAEFVCPNENCSAKVCLTDRQYQRHRERGTSFYCTAGHSLSYGYDSDNAKLKRRVNKLKQSILRKEARIAWLEDQLLCARKKWKCPFKRCWFETQGQGALALHLNTKHKLKPILQLAADAGPDALNTTVH